MDNVNSRSARLDEIRGLTKREGLFGYLVPSWDEYQCEECPIQSRRLEYITGFSGSSGIAIICEQQVILITDGRYLLQAAKQLFGINHVITNWIDHDKHIPLDALIGYDPALFTKAQILKLKGMQLKPISCNLVDQVWKNRPQGLDLKTFSYSPIYSGKSSVEKIRECISFLVNQNADYLIITDVVSINWLLNIRGNSLEYTPVVLGRAILNRQKLYFFTPFPNQIAQLKEWNDMVCVLEEEEFETFLLNLNEGKIAIDVQSCSIALRDLAAQKLQIVEVGNACNLSKACKNEAEINWTKLRHISDARALCESFAEIFQLYRESVAFSEYDVAQILQKHRKDNEGYICESFAAICGFEENSAIIHYKPLPFSSKIIDQGVLLIDSGGHYLGATTDVTRNLVLGTKVSSEQKQRYTQVLKGHIALALAHFPKGTKGQHLDVLARQFLRLNGADYPHGTGHGVGNCLSVHEGPQSISPFGNIVLDVGMILSNEPGYYENEKYGIRIENLCYVKESNLTEHFLCFEQLTLVPYCAALIELSDLSKEDKVFLKDYYCKIKDLVVPLLSQNARQWCMNEMHFILKEI
jgi:Xaa-Pro aminopeptidase